MDRGQGLPWNRENSDASTSKGSSSIPPSPNSWFLSTQPTRRRPTLCRIRQRLHPSCWLHLPHTWVRELWQMVTGSQESISHVAWPSHDESKTGRERSGNRCQIKGKVKAKLMVPKMPAVKNWNIAPSQMKKSDWSSRQGLVKVIVVPNKLVNIVTK